MTIEQSKSLKAISNNSFIPFFMRRKAGEILAQESEIGVAETYIDEYLSGVRKFLSRRRGRQI